MDATAYYFRIRKTCMEMLKDRGYLITEVRVIIKFKLCSLRELPID